MGKKKGCRWLRGKKVSTLAIKKKKERIFLDGGPRKYERRGKEILASYGR